MAKPVPTQDPSAVFDLDDNQRADYLASLGAKNATPPLPHSPYLKMKKTGKILPWEEIFAEHRDAFECCDEHGNTDPEAWRDKIITAPDVDPLEKQARVMTAVYESVKYIDKYKVEHAPEINNKKEQPKILFYSDILEMMSV